MRELLCESIFFGVAISLLCYRFGLWVKSKLHWSICNPLLIAILAVMAILLLLQIPYQSYMNSAKYLSYLLTPATICLAVPLYEQMELLRRNLKAVFLGIFSGVLTSLVTILALSFVFGLDHNFYVTLLPKSITTAIGMGVSEELGGIVTLTVAAIVLTGTLGNVIAEGVCKLFRIHEPIAKGVALGTSAHAIGTAKALEMGEVEGAMGSLSIAVAGLITVVLAPVFANFL